MVPFFIFLLIFFVDASIVFLTHSEMYNTARAIARKLSVEEITTAAEARDFAAQNLLLGQRTYTLTVPPAAFAEKTVTISVPMDDAAPFGYFMKPVLGRFLVATATMRREPLN